MDAATETKATTWTEADLQALPDDGFIHEVVNGELHYSVADLFKPWDWQ